MVASEARVLPACARILAGDFGGTWQHKRAVTNLLNRLTAVGEGLLTVALIWGRGRADCIRCGFCM